MDDKIFATMFEATRLTRKGRLNEATLAIQRASGHGHTPTRASTDVVDEAELIEEKFRLNVEAVAAPAASDTDAGTQPRRRMFARLSQSGPST